MPWLTPPPPSPYLCYGTNQGKNGFLGWQIHLYSFSCRPKQCNEQASQWVVNLFWVQNKNCPSPELAEAFSVYPLLFVNDQNKIYAMLKFITTLCTRLSNVNRSKAAVLKCRVPLVGPFSAWADRVASFGFLFLLCVTLTHQPSHVLEQSLEYEKKTSVPGSYPSVQW